MIEKNHLQHTQTLENRERSKVRLVNNKKEKIEINDDTLGASKENDLNIKGLREPLGKSKFLNIYAERTLFMIVL